MRLIGGDGLGTRDTRFGHCLLQSTEDLAVLPYGSDLQSANGGQVPGSGFRGATQQVSAFGAVFHGQLAFRDILGTPLPQSYYVRMCVSVKQVTGAR